MHNDQTLTLIVTELAHEILDPRCQADTVDGQFSDDITGRDCNVTHNNTCALCSPKAYNKALKKVTLTLSLNSNAGQRYHDPLRYYSSMEYSIRCTAEWQVRARVINH